MSAEIVEQLTNGANSSKHDYEKTLEYISYSTEYKKCPLCENGYIPVEAVICDPFGNAIIWQGYVECACGTAGQEAG
jgi:hypothetical protein